MLFNLNNIDMTITQEVKGDDILEYINSKMTKSDDSDVDRNVSEAIIPRVNRASWKELSGILRHNTNTQRCGCEHDCCGCVYSWGYDFKSIVGDLKNVLIVSYTHYNC